ncbi:fatty acid desaturase 6-like [Ptychodera flava]|uniref:fatty acid desaturase 6-like n=1 Tax=Ptychodera flava TaxID=63121 RepID=UPI00396AAA33
MTMAASVSVTRQRVELPDNVSKAELTAKVGEVVKKSSWWDMYGVDWCIITFFYLLLIPAFILMRSQHWAPFILGAIFMGLTHSTIATKVGHQAVHNSLCASKRWSKFWQYFFMEICGTFSVDMAHNIHIKVHHPYTNIIGFGDSSTFRVPILPRYIYMFVSPLLIPVFTPLFVMYSLLGNWIELIRCTTFIMAGLAVNAYLLVNVSGLSLQTAIFTMMTARAVLSIPYIHVNIFQHIGLPMYSKENHPKRLYLMSTGVLNLPRNPILDFCFGHSIISCHVEHHLFPDLSDNMCLKIKPIVRKFLTRNSLPYNEATYMNRLKFFIQRYEELMVKLPPITEFIGIQ